MLLASAAPAWLGGGWGGGAEHDPGRIDIHLGLSLLQLHVRPCGAIAADSGEFGVRVCAA